EVVVGRQADARLHALRAGVGQDRCLVEDGQHGRIRRLPVHGLQVRTTSMYRALAISVLSCMVTSAAAAQGSDPSKITRRPDSRRMAACAVNPGDAWVKRQVVWFDESKHDWTNDSLRTALLAATGLQAPLKAPVQNGVRVDGQAHTFGPTADAVTQDLMKL